MKISKSFKILLSLALLLNIFTAGVTTGQDNMYYSPNKDRFALKQRILEASVLFDEAVMNYEEGDTKTAEKLFKKSMKKLKLSKFDPELNYQLKEEMSDFFSKSIDLLESNDSLTDAPLEVSNEELKKAKDSRFGKKEGEKRYIIPINGEDELVKKYLSLYTEGKRKEIIAGALQRSGRYRDMIIRILKENGLPEELVYLPVVESLYKVNAYSHAHAVGLWQLMSKTGRNLGLKVNYWIDERKDPEKATIAAVTYLKSLYTSFDDWHLALSAYNRGGNGLIRDIRFSKSTCLEELQDRNALPQETENFVPKFIACTMIGDNYKDYGFDITFDKPLEYDEVTVNKVIDLEIAAKCADTDVSRLRELNPAIKAWCTPINYPNFKLKIPAGKKAAFEENIAKVKDTNPSRGYVRYKVRSGDVLGNIAKKFSTTVGAIKKDNKLKNANLIRPRQVLVIRPGRSYFAKNNN